MSDIREILDRATEGPWALVNDMALGPWVQGAADRKSCRECAGAGELGLNGKTVRCARCRGSGRAYPIVVADVGVGVPGRDMPTAESAANALLLSKAYEMAEALVELAEADAAYKRTGAGISDGHTPPQEHARAMLFKAIDRARAALSTEEKKDG